ncbi:TlpA family protein disulfide reductase [Sphingomonas tabacisoli]|uniref:TlpA family protein disulfide reductase n=1 Tax=Sphingomonas tabacisoli TaxID=2249466 RepID=A0ABW4HY17_9SPHN
MRPLIALLLGSLLIAGCDRQSGGQPQANESAAAVPEAKAPELTGKLDISQRGKAMPADSFLDPAGKPVTLAAFKGKPVLVNLWATWCGPCVREMPTLDGIAARAGDKLKVLTVSQDTAKVDIAPTWTKGGFKHLERYRDPDNKLGFAFNTGMLPTTVLYDKDGKEVWRVVGGMDWNGPRANTLLAEFIG